MKLRDLPVRTVRPLESLPQGGRQREAEPSARSQFPDIDVRKIEWTTETGPPMVVDCARLRRLVSSPLPRSALPYRSLYEALCDGLPPDGPAVIAEFSIIATGVIPGQREPGGRLMSFIRVVAKGAENQTWEIILPTSFRNDFLKHCVPMP